MAGVFKGLVLFVSASYRINKGNLKLNMLLGYKLNNNIVDVYRKVVDGRSLKNLTIS